MRHHRIIVLKFGGSVLGDSADVRRAVHEIYRWRRDGWQVVAVVSKKIISTRNDITDIYADAKLHARFRIQRRIQFSDITLKDT